MSEVELKVRLSKKCDDVIDSLSDFTIPEKEYILRTLHDSLIKTMRQEGIKMTMLVLGGSAVRE